MKRTLFLVFLGLLGWAFSASADITTGLQLYLAFNETSGTTAVDSSANVYSGTLFTCTGTTWLAAKVGNGLQFDGSSCYVAIPQAPNLSPGTGDLTIGVWVRPSAVDSAAHWIYSDYDAAGNGLILLRLHSDNTFQCYIRDSTGAQIVLPVSTTTPTANTWYHIICEKTGTTAVLYINNVQEATDTNGSLGAVNVDDATNKPVVGSSSANPTVNFFAGILDELRIFNRALSSGDRTELYNYGQGTLPRHRVIVQ